MESAYSIELKSSFHRRQNPFSDLQSLNVINANPYFPLSKQFRHAAVGIKASASTTPPNNPVIQNLKLAARAVIFSATAAVVISKFQQYPAIAKPITQSVVTTERKTPEKPLLPQFPESNFEINVMNTLLEKKLEEWDVEACLKILKNLISAQPENPYWIFMMGMLLNETGDFESARVDLEETLTQNPISFEALSRNALLMLYCEQGDAVSKRLKEALEIEEEKDEESRDVRFIIAQLLCVQGFADEALKSYDELLNEDPNDSRPYFCKGMIYSVMDKNDEAEVQFAKYRELSSKKC